MYATNIIYISLKHKTTDISGSVHPSSRTCTSESDIGTKRTDEPKDHDIDNDHVHECQEESECDLHHEHHEHIHNEPTDQLNTSEPIENPSTGNTTGIFNNSNIGTVNISFNDDHKVSIINNVFTDRAKECRENKVSRCVTVNNSKRTKW
jgi:hypothetical protein